MDVVARLGGEEFGVILPNCPGPFGRNVAERVRQCVQDAPVMTGVQQPVSVTISVGGAYAPQWVKSTPGLWSERADQQLYRAKAAGRNRVCIEPSVVSVVSQEEKGLLFDMTAIRDLE